MSEERERNLSSKPSSHNAWPTPPKLTRRDKLAWLGVGISIVILLLCWWARSSA